MIDHPARTPRRTFLTRLAALTAPIVGARLSAFTRHQPPPLQPTALDEAWLRRLTGKHRTMFDVEKHRNGHALTQAAAMLDVWHRDYRLDPPRVNIVIATRGTGIPIVLTDAVWARYRLGEQYEIVKSDTKAPWDVNPFSAANVRAGGPVTAEQTVEALQRRGALFLACRNTIATASRRLSAAGFGTPEEVQQTIEGSLLPGVVLVPAMLIAVTRMHENGVSYVYAG
jgi:intracellular sulfur oxidation DsrE/DsrF family protein